MSGTPCMHSCIHVAFFLLAHRSSMDDCDRQTGFFKLEVMAIVLARIDASPANLSAAEKEALKAKTQHAMNSVNALGWPLSVSGLEWREATWGTTLQRRALPPAGLRSRPLNCMHHALVVSCRWLRPRVCGGVFSMHAQSPPCTHWFTGYMGSRIRYMHRNRPFYGLS